MYDIKNIDICAHVRFGSGLKKRETFNIYDSQITDGYGITTSSLAQQTKRVDIGFICTGPRVRVLCVCVTCVSLLSLSISISIRTKNKNAHPAYTYTNCFSRISIYIKKQIKLILKKYVVLFAVQN